MDYKVKPQKPQPGVQVQVIGAGLPRTGTNSFCAAVSMLLNGPAYHVGIQSGLSGPDEIHVTTWIEVMQRWPPKNAKEKQQILRLMKERLSGYVCTADPPLSQLVPELMELYPDAKVLCSMREPDSWGKSMDVLYRITYFELLAVLWYWMPSLRWCPRQWRTTESMWRKLYGANPITKADQRAIWEKHHAWLEQIVPKEKLHFVNVKDGWEPFCKALNVPIPQKVDFPRLNDATDLEDAIKELSLEGLKRWLMVLGGVGVVLVGGWMLYARVAREGYPWLF